MKIYGDHLNRMQRVEDISAIIKTCVETGKPVTFSVEGEWGKGKTWIVKKIADSLEGIDLTQEKSCKNKKNCESFLVFEYNAWEKDYYDEPLLAILITLINQLNKHLMLENILKSEMTALFELSKDVLEESLRAISKRVIGIDVVDIGKRGFQIAKKVKGSAQLKKEADYSENNIEKDINTVVSTLNRLSKEIPIVFIVDELDRCLPEHTIKTLERLHHIFGKVNSSVTIISVNEAQLKTTVRKMFGDDIPFEAYLRKFVDFRISLDAGNADNEELQAKLREFFDLFGEEGDSQLRADVIVTLCNNMTARDFEKVCSKAILCHNLVGKETTHISRNYAIAELMLFASKIAIEKEGAIANILPIYVNEATTPLGKYLKSFFKELPLQRPTNLRSPTEKVCYICMMALLSPEKLEQMYDVVRTQESAAIESYYNEYIRYYRLIK